MQPLGSVLADTHICMMMKSCSGCMMADRVRGRSSACACGQPFSGGCVVCSASE